MEDKTLLYIVHDFPPRGGGGVMRAVKFCKYLPDFGWRPIVLTLKEEYCLPSVTDRSLFDALPPGLEIRRTAALKPTGVQRTSAVSLSASATTGARARLTRTLRDLKRIAGLRYGVAQDEGYLWLPYGMGAIDALLASRRIDAVLTSSPPHAVHWLGAYASRRGQMPWLADFRDGWTGDRLFQSRSSLRNLLERWQESRIIHLADRVTVAADKFDQWFVEAHGDAYVAKSALIPNGYDAEDFAAFDDADAPLPGSGPFITLAHLGGAGGVRRPIQPLLQALASLEACGVARGEVRLHFAGAIPPEDVEAATATPGVTVEAHVPHAQALARMRAADLLVLIQGRLSADSHSGKLFEYVAARKPILTLTYPGQLAEFVLRENWGWVAHPENVAEIQGALLRIYALWKEGRLAEYRPPVESRARFERGALTGRLAAILDDMVRAHAGARIAPK